MCEICALLFSRPARYRSELGSGNSRSTEGISGVGLISNGNLLPLGVEGSCHLARMKMKQQIHGWLLKGTKQLLQGEAGQER